MIAVINNDFKLDVVSVRLVKDAPILSDIKITTPDAAVELLGKYLCEMDREVLCVVKVIIHRLTVRWSVSEHLTSQ